MLLDEELTPWVLECNTNPAMWTSCAVTKAVCPEVIRATLDVAMGSFDEAKRSEKQSAMPSGDTLAQSGFEILFDGSLTNNKNVE